MKIEKRMKVTNFGNTEKPGYNAMTLQDASGNEVYIYVAKTSEHPVVDSYMTVTISEVVKEEPPYWAVKDPPTGLIGHWNGAREVFGPFHYSLPIDEVDMQKKDE